MDTQLIKKSKRHAWLVVAAGFFTFFMIYGAVINCFGLFMTPMSESLGIPRTITSSFFTIEMLTAIPAGLLFGRITDKYDLKWPMAICCALVGIGYLIFGLVTWLPLFYIASVLIGIGVAGTIQIPASVFINGWFVKRKGVAMGLTMVGSGIGGSILTQILNRIILHVGWQEAYLFLGAATIIITVPMVLLFVTKHPHRKGLLQYGEEDQEFMRQLEEEAKKEPPEAGKLSHVLKKPEFWLLFIGVTLFMLPMGAIKGHVVAYMTDLGYSPQVAANILTITIIAVIPGKPLSGFFFDRFGSKISTIICGLCMTIGIFLLVGVPASLLFAVAFGLIYGFGSAFASVGIPLCVKDTVFTNTNFATILSVVNIGYNVAVALGTTIMAAIHDTTGSYKMALVLSGVVIGLGYLATLIGLIIARTRKNAEEKNENFGKEVEAYEN